MVTIVQSPCYQILKKYLKNICIKDYIPFSVSVILSITYGLYSDNNIKLYKINITENIRKVLDDGNIVCGVFVDLRKDFDIVDHQILLTKLYHCEIRGVANDWLKLYLSNRNQNVSINGYESDLAAINFSVPQGSVLFLLFINDLN